MGQETSTCFLTKYVALTKESGEYMWLRSLPGKSFSKTPVAVKISYGYEKEDAKYLVGPNLNDRYYEASYVKKDGCKHVFNYQVGVCGPNGMYYTRTFEERAFDNKIIRYEISSINSIHEFKHVYYVILATAQE